MRFHKATKITGPEAAFLIQSNQHASRPAVVSFDGTWYDVRALSAKELQSFIDHVARTRHSRGFTAH
jgi:hypothetical protein